jgi:hypothetical protein
MKKETVMHRLQTIETRIARAPNEAIRAAQQAAIRACRIWLALPWSKMITPVEERCRELRDEAREIVKKKKQQAVTDEETARLQEIEAIYDHVYYPFYCIILPTARRARVDHQIKAEERARRGAPPTQTEALFEP